MFHTVSLLETASQAWNEATLLLPSEEASQKFWSELDRDSIQLKQSTVVYDSLHSLSAEIIRPGGQAPFHGVILVVHGGAWYLGHRTNIPDIRRFLALQGWIVVSVDYRLAPQFPYPSAVHDTQLALNWIHGAEFEKQFEAPLGPHRLVFGTSAGAHLAALACIHWQGREIDLFLGISGIYDLTRAGDLKSELWLNQFMPDAKRTDLEEASPSHAVISLGPPAARSLLFHQEFDPSVRLEQSLGFAAACTRQTVAKTTNELWVVPGQKEHGPADRSLTQAQYLRAVRERLRTIAVS